MGGKSEEEDVAVRQTTLKANVDEVQEGGTALMGNEDDVDEGMASDYPALSGEAARARLLAISQAEPRLWLDPKDEGEAVVSFEQKDDACRRKDTNEDIRRKLIAISRGKSTSDTD